MTIAFWSWVVLAATVWHTCVFVSVCQGPLVTISPCGCLYTCGSASVCLWVSFSVPCLYLLLSICACCANTAVAALSPWLLRVIFNFFSFCSLPSPLPPALTQCHPQSRVTPLVRSLCPCCPSTGWLLWGHPLAWSLWLSSPFGAARAQSPQRLWKETASHR